MTGKNYGTMMRIVAVTLAILIAVGIARQWPLYVPIIAIMLAMVVASVARRFVGEIMADERNRSIDEKAGAATYRIYTTVAGVVVLVAMMLRSSLPSWVTTAGETMAYAVCGLMLMHWAVSSYFGRKS